MSSKVALSVSLVVFIVLLNAVVALTEHDRDIAFLAKSLGATGRQRLVYFVLPAAIPVLVTGLQLGLVYSFLGVIAGELVGGSHGLGVQLAYQANIFATNKFFAILLLLAIVTSIVSACMTFVERRLFRWHYIEMRGI
jgi:NitT/TauT family transport system permease protein